MKPESQESRIIGLIRQHAGHAPDIPLGIGDDAAILPLPPGIPVVTTDAMVEGVHWDDKLSPADVGWKLVAVNASDLGAMGARPQWATLSLSLPTPLDWAWVEQFAQGLGEACRFFSLPVVGGDTTRGGTRTLVLTAGGVAKAPVLRSTGRVDDDIWVTGSLGRSAVAFLEADPPEEALSWFRRPRPPTAFGVALAEAGLVSAMMDLSDGLATDLPRLSSASGCGVHIHSSLIPGIGSLNQRLCFGEDYELLFTAPSAHKNAIASLSAMHRTPVTRIGTLTASRSLVLDTDPWPLALFDHFPESETP